MPSFRIAAIVAALTLLIQVVAASILVEFRQETVVEGIYAPILYLAGTITPREWQVQGNTVLGLSWLLFGAATYSAGIGLLAGITVQLAVRAGIIGSRKGQVIEGAVPSDSAAHRHQSETWQRTQLCAGARDVHDARRSETKNGGRLHYFAQPTSWANAWANKRAGTWLAIPTVR